MAPLEFLSWLRRNLRSAGIQFAITSGQACVHYGIQQTTKDSDWIIALDDIDKLRHLLSRYGADVPFRTDYRGVCGAPLSIDYLRHGWTTHLTILELGKAFEHHVDIFGKPPRVSEMEFDATDSEIASRHVVAMMKKTDRDKDWPMVFSLGRQMLEQGDWRGVLHFQDADWLIEVWPKAPAQIREQLIELRPLLAMINERPQRLRRAIAIEKVVWVAINRGRYTCYQRSWKQFFRQWRREPAMQWPVDAPFSDQHQILCAACDRNELPMIPFDESVRRLAFEQALVEAADIMAATPHELQEIVPSIDVLLP